MKYDVLIIGAGPAGITSALTSKDMGYSTALIESNDRIGKKILTTGNGRCNITNKNLNTLHYHSDNHNFFENVLKQFNFKDTENFFLSLGLPLTELENGKMYPMSLQASSVLDILRIALNEKEIPIHLNTKVKEIKKFKNGFKILSNKNEVFECKKLILACGGKSAPSTGSDGSGYNLAKSLNHKIIEPIPALVQLKLDYNKLKALSGIKFNGFAEITINNKPIKKEYGEILFTDYGISGPPILQLSRIASYYLNKTNDIILKLDLMPSFSEEALSDFLENHWGIFGYRSVSSSFIGILNKKLIPIFLKSVGILDIHKLCLDLNWKEKNNIIKSLKNWCFKVNGTNGFKNSQVTAGGVDTKFIDSNTLESKLIPNLYFCGEILDVDGDCGGFNLQWAWSSGFVSGKSQIK